MDEPRTRSVPGAAATPRSDFTGAARQQLTPQCARSYDRLRRGWQPGHSPLVEGLRKLD